MNDGKPSTGLTRPRGTVARIRFLLKKTLTGPESCATVTFWSNEFQHNVLSTLDGNELYLPIGEQPGFLYGPEYDTAGCPDFGVECIDSVRFRQVGCASTLSAGAETVAR